MKKPLFDRIVQALLPDMDDPAARKSLIESALFGSPVLQKIPWGDDAGTFTRRLVRVLDDFGEVESNRPALVALLEEVRGQIGGGKRQTQIDRIIKELQPPPAEIVISAPTASVPGDLYVFISYARPEQPLAEKLETYLKAAGVKVFRDTSKIREGANWDLTIEDALRESQRMVLLVSSSSMPHRKEVHREWFYFDQKRKPIYPLYVEDCDLHSRMYAYNYIDVRTNLQAGFERLLAELRRDFDLPESATGADKVAVFEEAVVEERTLPQALQALLDAVRNPEGGVVLSVEQAVALKDHKPADLIEYRLSRIAEWSLPRYVLDKRFVNLTLLLDKGEQEQQRWQKADDFRFNDLRDLLKKISDPVFVLLGAPGSGKSTLLRRLQLDHSIDSLRDGSAHISLFIPLNSYRARSDGGLPEPREWLEGQWSERYPNLPPLAKALREGQVLLLLDALNEMPHKSAAEYHERVSLWRTFTQEIVKLGNRVVFSCRSLDYSASLSSPELRVPQIDVQPMDADQMQAFLKAYVPTHEAMIWRELNGSPQYSLFQTPYFLKLLCEQVEATRTVPKGRASLFTGFVRQVLSREINSPLFQPDTLLSEKDHQKLTLGKWRSPFELPERGVLLPKLSTLAFSMQEKGLETEGAQVRIDYDDACDVLAHPRSEDILKAGVALSVLDEDITQYEMTFFHQLLQEFFAARTLAQTPNPSLVHVEWHVNAVKPTLEEALAGLADGDPLLPLPQTGWEETTLTAAPMSSDPNAFIRDLMAHNLPLAARCAASPEVSIQPDLKRDIQQALIARTQDFQNADVRARIAAGLALGTLGDPRFERKTGPHGDYLLPPLVTIEGGVYPMGLDDGPYNNEKPAHTVDLKAFQIGQFPMTNAEYALFMAAGGYQDEQWWDTDESRAWLKGEGSTDGQKAGFLDLWNTLQSWSDERIRGLVAQNRATTEQAEQWIELRNMSKDELEQQLEEWYPSGKIYRQPEYWNDSKFNSPSQPVVGVTWFEARAYCAWLSAQTGQRFEVPSEAQFEAAARGKAGHLYPYGAEFEVSRSNMFESHLRRTTPVGLFDNATPQGAFDLTGNAYTWTTSLYDQEQFPYPYRADDGRENICSIGKRVQRGGSWFNLSDYTRAVYRFSFNPLIRYDNLGFRVCSPF